MQKRMSSVPTTPPCPQAGSHVPGAHTVFCKNILTDISPSSAAEYTSRPAAPGWLAAIRASFRASVSTNADKQSGWQESIGSEALIS